jgi:P pilus assembly chaperone PapD
MRIAARIAALVFAASSSLCPFAASAEVAVYVSPMVIELKGAPGSSQHGAVTVRNTGHSEEVVSFVPIAWSVNEYGDFSIDRTPVDPDRNISPFLSISQPRAHLMPGETRTVLVAATMPQAAERSYWGGYLVSVSDGSGGASAGATVVIYADPGTVVRHLRFDAIDITRSLCQPSVRVLAPRGRTAQATPAPRHTCLVARFKNDSDGYARTGAHLTVTRRDVGREPRVVLDQPVTVGVVLPGKTHTVMQPLDALSPGSYVLRLTLDYGADHVIDGEKAFTLR